MRFGRPHSSARRGLSARIIQQLPIVRRTVLLYGRGQGARNFQHAGDGRYPDENRHYGSFRAGGLLDPNLRAEELVPGELFR
jgi:hypothetical protein